MIGTKDIEQILVGDLSSLLSVSKIFVTDDIPDGYVTEERITVHVKQTSIRDFFNKCFVEVNYAVPDIAGHPSPSLQSKERLLVNLLDSDKVGVFNSTWYRYGVESHQILSSELHCHYVNVRILFETLNVRN